MRFILLGELTETIERVQHVLVPLVELLRRHSF